MKAVAPPWTSLSEIAPATPVLADVPLPDVPLPVPIPLPLPLLVEELPRVMVAIMLDLSWAVTAMPPGV